MAGQCAKGHEVPPLSSVLRAFSLEEEDTASVYVVGSHLWGTCHPRSDWDLVVVVNSSARSSNRIKTPQNAHKGRFDAWLLSTEEYGALVKEHSLQVLVTLWVPGPMKIKETRDAQSLFRYSHDTLVGSSEKMYERDLRVAEKKYRKGDVRGGSRTLQHCLRCLLFATQVKQHGRIVDYAVSLDGGGGGEVEGMFEREKPWEVVWSEFQPRFERVLMELRA